MKWGKRHEFFSIFFIENELSTENVKNGVRGNEPNGRMVQPKQLILISFDAEFCVPQVYREFFWIFNVFFELYIFSQKNAFLPIERKVQRA